MEILLPLFVLGIIGIAIIMVLTSRVAPREVNWLRVVLISALLLRFGAATMFATMPETRIFHEDAGGYEEIGVMVAQGWKGDGPPIDLRATRTINYGYHYVTAACYFILGSTRPAPSYLNAIIGIITIFLIYRLARRLFHPVVARRAAAMMAFFPSFILWNSIAIKDTLMTFLIVISVSSCLSLKRQFTTRALLGTVLPVIAIQPIRFYMIYFLIPAILGSLFFERGLRAVSGFSKLALVTGAVLGLLAIAGFAGSAEEGAEMVSFQTASNFRKGMANTAQSGFSHDVDISSPTRALAFLPIGVAMLLFAPFPWQFTSMRATFAAPEMIIWWLLIPSLIRGIVWAVRKRFSDCSPLLFFSVILTLAYSMVHGNIGSGFRQRVQIFVFLFIFASLGQYVSKCRRHNVDENLLLEGVMPLPAPPINHETSPEASKP